MPGAYTRGWYQVAFGRDLDGDLTPVGIGGRRLVLARVGGRVRAFDADCPHRGAHLGVGGRQNGDRVTCPFHGYQICLGGTGNGFRVREYPVLDVGGMIFVRLGDGPDNGWPDYTMALVRDYHLIPGFELSMRCPMETVIENAFDRLHFTAVHGVRTDGFAVHTGAAGELVVESTFQIPASAGRTTPAGYRAVVVSPGIAMVELQGPFPYAVITGATDAPGEGCAVRLTLALPRNQFVGDPPPAAYEPLLGHSRRGLEEDRAVWENLSPTAVPSWTADDDPARAFHAFCERFRDG